MKSVLIFCMLVTGNFALADFSHSVTAVDTGNQSNSLAINLDFSKQDKTQFEMKSQILFTSAINNKSCPSIPAGAYEVAEQPVSVQFNSGNLSARLASIDGPVRIVLVMSAQHVGVSSNLSGDVYIEQVNGYYCSNAHYKVVE